MIHTLPFTQITSTISVQPCEKCNFQVKTLLQCNFNCNAVLGIFSSFVSESGKLDPFFFLACRLQQQSDCDTARVKESPHSISAVCRHLRPQCLSRKAQRKCSISACHQHVDICQELSEIKCITWLHRINFYALIDLTRGAWWTSSLQLWLTLGLTAGHHHVLGQTKVDNVKYCSYLVSYCIDYSYFSSGLDSTSFLKLLTYLKPGSVLYFQPVLHDLQSFFHQLHKNAAFHQEVHAKARFKNPQWLTWHVVPVSLTSWGQISASDSREQGSTRVNPVYPFRPPGDPLMHSSPGLSHTLLHMSGTHLRGRGGHSVPLALCLSRSLFDACVLGCWSCKCFRMKELVWRWPLWPL